MSLFIQCIISIIFCLLSTQLQCPQQRTPRRHMLLGLLNEKRSEGNLKLLSSSLNRLFIQVYFWTLDKARLYTYCISYWYWSSDFTRGRKQISVYPKTLNYFFKANKSNLMIELTTPCWFWYSEVSPRNQVQSDRIYFEIILCTAWMCSTNLRYVCVHVI